MTAPTLYAIHYSPWSLRAKWALEHHRIDFQYREHTPLLGEWALRRRGRGVKGPVTVPMLVLPDRVLSDSWDIICHADRHGHGDSLHTDDPEVAHWARRLEPAYDAARRRATQKSMESNAALTEAAAAVVPRAMAGLLRPVAALGARFIARKYQFDPKATDTQGLLAEALEDIRAALDGGPFITDSFSAADIVAASLITAVRPHAQASLGPAMRAVWTDEGLAERFSDLVAWRDTLRGPPQRSGITADAL